MSAVKSGTVSNPCEPQCHLVSLQRVALHAGVAALRVLYISFVNLGQIFYAFGWESILLDFRRGLARCAAIILAWQFGKGTMLFT